jgi:hypothetical protein
MKSRIVMVVLCALGVAAFSTLVVAADKETWVGEGIQINIRWTGAVYTISSSEPCWVRHGWGGPEVGPGENSAYLHDNGWVINGGMYFDLYINGEKVSLRCQNIHNVLDTPGHSVSTSSWYRQFPSGHFAPGVYEITGEWGCRNPRNANNDGGGLPWQSTVWLIVEP